MSLHSQKPHPVNMWNRSSSHFSSSSNKTLFYCSFPKPSLNFPSACKYLYFFNHLHTCGLFWWSSAARRLFQLLGHNFSENKKELLQVEAFSCHSSPVFLRNSGCTWEAEGKQSLRLLLLLLLASYLILWCGSREHSLICHSTLTQIILNRWFALM